MIWGMKEEAKRLAKKKWTRERWQTEILNDQGLTYRTSGSLMGFNLGAAAGMLIGKGFQGKKIERQKRHTGGWYGDEYLYTENFYAYKRKHAPYWGAVIGGTAGAVTGYFLGKRADKKYYILVPEDIRMVETHTSWVGNSLIGLGIVGPIMGVISGHMLYAPESAPEDEANFGGSEFLGGYLIGSITGTFMVAAIKEKSKHKQLWEQSLEIQAPESSMNIQLIPLDQNTFSIQHRSLPSGETYYEYQIDLVRVRF
jgi:hypothetical protein